jgi:hypothetical protein
LDVNDNSIFAGIDIAVGIALLGRFRRDFVASRLLAHAWRRVSQYGILWLSVLSTHRRLSRVPRVLVLASPQFERSCALVVSFIFAKIISAVIDGFFLKRWEDRGAFDGWWSLRCLASSRLLSGGGGGRERAHIVTGASNTSR